MTTLFKNRLSIIAPAENVAGMILLAAAVGETVSFPVRLSANGAEPATHCGMSTVTTDKMFALLSRAMPFPDGIDEPAANALLDAMIMSRLT
ncbi:MAG: hypothetical protein VX228_06390, partial [Pseudomonadota bacterium]|nr:hypothetical protein [Pseudomonadota bacterium]